MAHFIWSAFADEVSENFDEQLQVLKDEGISLIELRGANGKNCSQLTLEEADILKIKLDAAGVRLSALGSPFGKAQLALPFDEHLALFRHGLELCRRLDCSRIRMFSFYPPKGDRPEDWKAEVFSRLETMLTLAEQSGVQLVHENEKDIYGDVTDRCAQLMEHFFPQMGFVFDPANFVQCGVRPLEAYDTLRPYITYLHIKDALMADGAVVPAGCGDGDVAAVLARVNREFDADVILTVEPHLKVFPGLEHLQDEGLTHHYVYPDNRSAFHAACTALRDLLNCL